MDKPEINNMNNTKILIDTNVLYYACGLSTPPKTVSQKRLFQEIDAAQSVEISSIFFAEFLTKYRCHAGTIRRVCSFMRQHHIYISNNEHMDVADVVDSASDGIQQSRTAPGEVLFLGHARHSAQRQAVMDDHALVVKKHRGDQRLARFLLLLFDHGAEATDGVFLQPAHGAAPVQDKNQFCHSEKPPLSCAFSIAQTKEGLVA